MKTSEAIAELARRQLALEKRIAALESADEEVGDPWGDEPGIHEEYGNLDNDHETHRQLHAQLAERAKYEPWAWREENGDLVFAPPSEAQRTLRARLAKSLGFEHWTMGDEGSAPLPPEEAIPAYIEGGPGWLYHYDRDFVMSLPEGVRRAMVVDVESVAPQQAHEFGADLLKDADPGTPDRAEDDAKRVWDA